MTQYKVHRIRFIDYLPKSINSATYDSSAEDGKVALSREDGSIEIRSPENDFTVQFIIPGQDGRSVEHLAWCKGRLFSGGLIGDIIEWDLIKLVPKYCQDSYGGPVWCLEFSHSCNRLAAGCEDGSVRLFQVTEDGLSYEKVLNIQKGRILSLSWDFTDSIIVSGGFDSSMRLYNILTGQIYSRMSTEKIRGSKTMVWSVHFLKDKTIVMGDSLGNTQFWDGDTSTLVKSYKSHAADVLAIAVTDDQKKVYSTGVDCQVVEFILHDFGNDNWGWLLSKKVRASDYDTRTLIFCNKPYPCLLAGGIDPRLVLYNTSSFSSDTWKRYTCLPSKPVCNLAFDKNILIFREQHKLHAWNLCNASIEHTKPKKVVEINIKDNDHLVSSAISSNGKYISCSTIKKGNLYELANISDKLEMKKVSIHLPGMLLMEFTTLSEELVYVNHMHLIHVLNLDKKITSSINFPKHIIPQLPFTHLAISPSDKYICLVDSRSNAYIFSLAQQNFITRVPDMNTTINSCQFHPENENIIFSTSSKELFEFDINKEKFTPWALALNKEKTFKQMLGPNQINHLTFNPKNTKELFLQTKELFGKLEYDSTIDEVVESGSKRKKRMKKYLKLNRDYYDMMFFEFTSNGDLVIIERLTESILQSLPESLKIKRFGK